MPAPRGGSLESLRAANRALVLRAVERAGSPSRADLVRSTGLARSTVSSLVQDLIDDGLLVEREEPGRPHRGGSGRPPTLLELAAPRGIVAGIDIGHRHVRVAVARLDSTVLAESVREVDVDRSARESLDLAGAMVRELVAREGFDLCDVRGCGLGIPGPVERGTGRLTSSIMPGWRGVVPADEIESRLGVRPLVDNDAHVGALGELTYGAARGGDPVIYVKASTGLGAGIIVGGRLLAGTSGIAGEIGHVHVNDSGPVCRCGSRGCLETEVAAPKLVELLQPARDEVITVESMLRLADEGEAGVTRVLNDAGRTIGRVLADLCNMLNPGLVVLGGAMGHSTAVRDGVRESVDRFAQPNAAASVEIRQGTLGERAEVMGALCLALQQAHAAS